MVEPFDKIPSALVAMALASRMPERFRQRFPLVAKA